MEEIMDKFGIKQLTTRGRDSQANDKCERLNRTLLERIRGNLFNAGLGNEVGQGGYLTSYETIEFGRLVYLSRDHQLVGKLDPRAVPAFYLGPSEKGFGYAVLVIVSGKGKGTTTKVIDTTHIDVITPESITYHDWLQ
ncbi:unnamed protein product [Ambrosiozyma monospora]|uniref:Unnamed protein product n=1 Tax=Ambrosiozyma monospora TaxID=43982 RepID=A0ACB5SV54_AMBMO|nr:unnamed protein product [Ambrosiozyma monospora]